MYEYKFIKVEVNRWKGKPKEDYKEIIEKYSQRRMEAGSNICSSYFRLWGD